MKSLQAIALVREYARIHTQGDVMQALVQIGKDQARERRQMIVYKNKQKS